MIIVHELYFQYEKKPILQNLNFKVYQGEVLGILGPSGAGKSTLQKILTGVIRNYKGSVIINNQEIRNVRNSFYQNIGVDFEFPTLFDKLTARQNLKYFISLYQTNQCDINDLLNKVGLLKDADRKVCEFSKGMKSRLNFIKALLHNPQFIFLDEPLSGLDPTNAKIMKNIIIEEKKKGKTIILTTHNMADATELCTRVAFIVDGSIKALDTPHNLIMQVGATQITYTWEENGIELSNCCDISDTGANKQLHELLKANRLTSIHSSEPTLNDIFIKVTGRTLL